MEVIVRSGSFRPAWPERTAPNANVREGVATSRRTRRAHRILGVIK
ncbi:MULTISPECIES: hypothetical protein [Burkholderia cepacia complex]|nr:MULTISPECIES: hypothetical protein [Burkholderia cepacia complex]EKS9839919.1 hypothetical protein [Burkholderia cepacia]MBJ9729443.1 hypothetical protein [Burkholderia cenocepacia]MDN7534763.1 hypothetical protein [Burkholderia orbicola]MDR8028795.1 hypothetical protein [Burkholderia cenocepacia]MDR8039185.1 hypothetical protein [Burkholderia cenocepacia]